MPNLILAGDINFTITASEIWGDKSRLDHLCHYFSHFLNSSNLVDLAPQELGPTWRNGRPGSEGISKRIDIFLASIHLIPFLNDFKYWIHPSKFSDHFPVFLEIKGNDENTKCPFKFNPA